jgi:hypothetical protein
MKLRSTLLACGSAFHKYLSLGIEDPSLTFSPVEKAELLAPGGEFTAGLSAMVFHPAFSA